jgi:O-antigen biosynthesis protein WbqP
MMSIKRIFDLVIGVNLFVLLFVPMLLIAVLVILTSKGAAIHWSSRIGLNNEIFKMPKFRSMTEDVPNVATHLMQDSDRFLTSLGGFLRRFSLDELPQLFSIIKGDMSFVGPRPALFNQDDLIALRKKNGVDRLIPGLTGWAQVNGRDDISIAEKVALEVEYSRKKSFRFDLHIILLTILRVVKKDGVSH